MSKNTSPGTLKLCLDPDIIKLFRDTFKGREDIVAQRWVSKKTGKPGYSPICKNFWKKDVCRKIQKKKCKGCPNEDYQELKDELIDHHIRGYKNTFLGVYPLLKDNTCHFLAADFDKHKDTDPDPLNDLKAYYEVCKVQEIPCYILRSRSGNGYHAYIFFNKAISAGKARLVGKGILEEADIKCDDSSSFDKLFPNQSKLTKRSFGNLIGYPWQGDAMNDGNTLFLDPDTDFNECYKDQIEVLRNIQKIDESVLNRLINDWDLKEADDKPQEKTFEEYCESNDYPLSNFEIVKNECPFITHCVEDAETLAEQDWYIAISIVSRCENGESIAHEISEPYPGYKVEESAER